MSNKFFTKSDETFTGVDLTSYVNGSLLTKEQFSNSIQTNYLWPEGENYSTNQLIYENDVYNLSQDIKLTAIYLENYERGYTFASNVSSEIDYDKFALYNFTTDSPIDIGSNGYVDSNSNAISLNDRTLQNEYTPSIYHKICAKKDYDKIISNYFDFTIKYKTVTSTNRESLNVINYEYIPFDGSVSYLDKLDEARQKAAGYDSSTINSHGFATKAYAYPERDNCAYVYIYWNDVNAVYANNYAHRVFDIENSSQTNYFRVKHTGLNNYHNLNEEKTQTGGTSIIIDVCMRLDGEIQPVMTMSTAQMNVGIDSVKFVRKLINSNSYYSNYIEDSSICQGYAYNSDNNSLHSKYYYQENMNGYSDGETASLLKQMYVYGDSLQILPVIKFKTGEIFAMFEDSYIYTYNNANILNNILTISTNNTDNPTYIKIPDYNNYASYNSGRTYNDIIYVDASYKDQRQSDPYDTKNDAFERVNFSSNPGDVGYYTNIEFKLKNPNGETYTETTLRKLTVFTKKLYPKLQYVTNQIPIISNPDSRNREFFVQMDNNVSSFVTSGNIGFEVINIEKETNTSTYYLNHLTEQNTLLPGVFSANVKYQICYNSDANNLQTNKFGVNTQSSNTIYNMSNSDYRTSTNGVLFDILPYNNEQDTVKLQFDVYFLYKPTTDGAKKYYQIAPYSGQIGRRYTVLYDNNNNTYDVNNMTNTEVTLNNDTEASNAKGMIIWDD